MAAASTQLKKQYYITMIKTEIEIDGVKYTIRAQTGKILKKTIRDLKKLHKNKEDKDAI